MAKLSTLVDLFDGSAVNTAVWNNSSTAPGMTLDTALDRVKLLCQATYQTLSALGPFDATDSSFYARITPAPVGAGTTQTIMRFGVDANNRVTYYTDGGGILTARVTNAGVNTNVVIGTYDPYAHAWWRLRESGGNILFDTSPDGWTWTNRASIAHTWSTAAVFATFLCGYYGSEAAGMAGYVDHVNTTTSAPGQLNLNWPLVEDGWGPYWNANAGATPTDRYVEVTKRTRGTVSVSRGSQYELDQVRSGEASLSLANVDAALDPLNTSGPWSGHIAPYQPYRRRAQWPPTRNILTQVQATGGDLGGYALGTIPDAARLTWPLGAGTIAASATAWQGARVFNFTVPVSTAANAVIVQTAEPAVEPGAAYTHTVRVRNVATSGTLQVKPYIAWYTAGSSTPTYVDGSTVGLVGSASATWTTFTVSATAPANAAGVEIGLRVATLSAATAQVQVDGWQLEKAATATDWTCPGVWFPVYGGFMERWPSAWDMAGTYGKVAPNAVDTLALLSQQPLDAPLTMEINSHSPRFLFMLDDPSGSTTVADATGNFQPAPLAISKQGAGSFTFGAAITAASAAGTYTGSTGTVAAVDNANPGSNTNSAATFLALHQAGITGPANPSGTWTRMIAFRYTGGSNPTDTAELWTSLSAGDSGWRLSITSSGQVSIFMVGGGSSPVGSSRTGGTAVADGNWHLVIVSYSHDASDLILSVDGVSVTHGINTAIEPVGLVSDTVGSLADVVRGNSTRRNFKGNLSYICEFPTALDTTDMANLYAAWKSACAGESTDARYARILRYAGYSGASSLQSGVTTNMGPAAIEGQDAVSALQRVVDTEGGAHYVARDGTITFRSRGARYNALTPAYVFGERTDLGEWPYEDCAMDYDSTHLSNQVTVTQEGTSQTFYARDDDSVTAYFPRPMSRALNSADAEECHDAANYLLSRYRQPAMRVSSLKLHPSANPGLWPVCLALELGTRVRVMRRPPGAPTVQVECFIENLQWEFGDNGDAWLVLQCSPADLTAYAVFAAWHTTLTSTIASGVTSITVNASADNTNPLAAQLAPGQQLTLGHGTANTETVTVLTVGTTSPGWTTATITLTAATTKSHTAGDVVCEPLPSGTTDPATWDAVAAFDSVAFAY
ncbi:hypothetical protein F3K32_42515 [Streptomyces sp. LBUM 1483]|uniref:LamG domain-containing protein n=1 Tax=Streptomyces scabiei TaxID=1930 RepID=UPI001B3308F8|nr:LamG domain-containing protein [Streptomyces sp. LBUM 1483]MBP5926683.1 hypothetical protein [Streptomyces sp. LBUM 1483]